MGKEQRGGFLVPGGTVSEEILIKNPAIEGANEEVSSPDKPPVFDGVVSLAIMYLTGAVWMTPAIVNQVIVRLGGLGTSLVKYITEAVRGNGVKEAAAQLVRDLGSDKSE